MSDPNNPPPTDPSQTPPPGATPPPPPPGGAARPPGATPPPGAPVPYMPRVDTGYPGPYIGPPPDSDARTMAMLAHILGIFTSFLGPLIIWLVKKDQQPFVDYEGKETLNFKLMMLFVYVGIIVLSCLTLGLAGFLFFPVWIVEIIFGVLAAIETNKGTAYRYPINLRMIK